MISEPVHGFDSYTKANAGFSLSDDFPEPIAELDAALRAAAGRPCEATYARDAKGTIWALYTVGDASGVFDGKSLVWDHSDPEEFQDRLIIFTHIRGYKPWQK